MPSIQSQDLEDAFALFNRMSAQLEGSYRELEDQVARLTRELAAARSERLQELAEKERLAARLERLLDLLPGGILVLDAGGVIEDCNPAAVALLGEPLKGQDWHSVMGRAFRAHHQDDGELELRSGRRISLSTASLGAGGGRIVLLTDVSEQFGLRQLVQRNQRLSSMGEMAAGLAHQVRTPLASALLYLSHLERPALDQQRRERCIARIRERLGHLERIVTGMLEFARGGGFAMERVEIGGLLEDLRQAAADLGLALQVEAPAETLWVRGNRPALQSALLNLVENAGEAGGPDVHITARAEAADGRVRLAVEDDGPGFAAGSEEAAFEPFHTTRPDGTGLGLAVVRAVVRAHGGGVRAHNRAAGGARIEIELPALSPEAAALPDLIRAAG